MTARSHHPTGGDAPPRRTFWGYDRPVRRDPMFWAICTLSLLGQAVGVLVGRNGPFDVVSQLTVGTVGTTLFLGTLAGIVREFSRGCRERRHYGASGFGPGSGSGSAERRTA